MKTLRLSDTREIAIPRIINEYGCQEGAEIGVFKGVFSRTLLEKWSGTLWMIDPWRPFGDDEGYIDSSNHRNHETAYLQAMQNLEGFEQRSFMLRGLSSDLVGRFANEELDFVYIDGNHAYDFVKFDISAWWQKVKPGGWLMGHDYLDMSDWYSSEFSENGKDKHVWLIGPNPGDEYEYAGIFGVNTAVDEFVKENDLELSVTSEWLGSWIIRKPLI